MKVTTSMRDVFIQPWCVALTSLAAGFEIWSKRSNVGRNNRVAQAACSGDGVARRRGATKLPSSSPTLRPLLHYRQLIMSVCCIGGICIPYTAIIPLLLLALRWLAEKLARLGLLPESVVQHLGIHITEQQECNQDGKSCCNATKKSITKPNKLVHSVESMQDWRSLKEEHNVLMVKFTATWCRPCQEVAPVFADLSQEYNSEGTRFVQVDVDDLDEVASEHNVAIMPTFVCIKRGREISSMRGSNVQKLTSFVKQHVSNETK